MENFTTEELVLLNMAGPVFTISTEEGSNACNLQIGLFEGQVYEIDIVKKENGFDVDVLINGESTGEEKGLSFSTILALVHSLDDIIFELITESMSEEEEEPTSEYLS